MAVLARDRKTSGLEFYRTARKLQKSLYFLMMRDFGTKDKVRDVKAFTNGMEPQDADLLLGVLEKYHTRKINTYWPEWTIQHVRDTICQELNRLMCSLESAMVIWPRMRAEYEERRVQQDRALGLFLHPKKTQTSKLSRGVRFLNTRYRLTETGRIARGIPRDVVVRERRKLKHLAALVQQGELTRAAFVQQYKSWRGDKKRYDAHGILVRMDDLYHELLGGMEHGRRKGSDGSSPEEGAAHH